MVRTSTYAIALLGSVVAMTAAQRTQEELDKLNAVGRCINKCFDKSFAPGSCTNDPACTCNQEKMRNDYMCCEVKECANINEVATERVAEHLERTWQACGPLEHNRPFDKPDVEKLCGVSLKVSSSSSPSSTAAPIGSSTIASSPSSTAAAQTTGTSAPAGASTSASSPGSTGAAAAVRGSFVLPGLAAVVAGLGLALC
ncbi:hypothetical protein PpBr36_00492 [Pyricularia pennisetigena]|uniref:hypothetical protein n=1 Tax=Pyricularia pennisetigena TaxID=1578925 RepID=UPI001152C7A6|nr:hypothetical protein PpBr36_00492 [Pyricularia pennisetigena]TLS29296.1 hypothetical protein PpBr36_00492 [Pyricularia pennisetigena]